MTLETGDGSRRVRRHTWLSAALLATALLSGCAASRAFQRAEEFGSHGDWDSAVAYYRRAMQADPNKPEYKIALERAMLQASRQHLDRAREGHREGRQNLGGPGVGMLL